MLRTLLRTALLAMGLAAVIGCHGPDLGYVPWYRGIPANFLAKNSLEAEVWRQQRTGVVEGWPVPPNPVVREPIPLAGSEPSVTEEPLPPEVSPDEASSRRDSE